MIFSRHIFSVKSSTSTAYPSLLRPERFSKAISPQALLKCSVSPGIRSLNRLLSFLLRSQKLTLLLETFSQLSLNSVQIDSHTHFLVTHALLRSRRYEEANQFIFPTDKYDFVVRKSLWDSLIREVCVSGGDPERALSLLHECMRNQSTSPHLITFRALILSFSSVGMMERALEVLETMISEKVGYPFDNFITSSIISGFSRIGKSDIGLGFYTRVRKCQHFQPNLMTYTAVVDALCREGRIDEASNLVQEMENNGIVLDAVLYTSWMCGYFRKGLLMDGFLKHSLMRRNGVVADVVSYTALIDGLCKEGHLEKVIGFFEYMKKIGLTPNLFTHTSIIQGFCKRSKMDEAFFVFRKMEKLNLVPDEFVYSVLIDGLCTTGRLDEVFDVLEEMDINGIKATSLTYNTVVNGLCKSGRTRKADEISRNYFGDNFTFSTLLHGYMKEKDEGGVIDSKKRLEQSGITLDMVTVNVLIKALFAVGMVDYACSLFQEMPERGLTADSVTYCTMVDGYCQLGMADRALAVYMEYKRSSVFVNDVCHGHMIVELCRVGKVEVATEHFLELCERNIVSDSITYRKLMKAQFKNGNGQEILKFISRVEGSDYELVSSICNYAVSFLCQRDCFPYALETYILMRMKSLTIWSKSYYVLLKSLINSGNGLIIELILCDYIKACGIFEPRMVDIICLYLCKKNVEEAIQFLHGLSKKTISLGVLTVVVCTLKERGRIQDAVNILLEAEENNVPVEVVVYSILVEGFCRGLLEKALDLCSIMMKKGIIPNIITYNSVIHGLCCEGCLLEAFRVFDSLEYNGLVPTIVTYATLIGALSREGFLLDAKKLFGRMVAKGIYPNTLTYNSLINGHCSFGSLEEGIELVKNLAGSSMDPDNFTISSIICGYCSNGDIQGALNFYNEYIEKGFSPDFLGLLNIIKGLVTKGRMEEARNIIRDVLQHGEMVDLMKQAGDGMNFESLSNYIMLVCKEGRIQEVISILSDVGSKVFSSWWSKNSSNAKEVKQHAVGFFSKDTQREVSSNTLQSVEDGILEKKISLCKNKCINSGVDGYHFLQQNSLDYDFETCYSFIAAVCSKGELQKANDLVKVAVLNLTKKH